MYYISVSNGLIQTPEHRKKMGAAVWEFMWCLDKITKIDDEGVGWVLGGKPVKAEEMNLGHRNTVYTNLDKLEAEGYIKTTRTPNGKTIKVMRAKKIFSGKSKEDSDAQKPVHLTKEEVSRKVVHLSRKTVHPSRKTMHAIRQDIDKTVDNIKAGRKPAKKEVVFNPLGAEVIKKFVDVVDNKNKTYYSNKTQRAACDFLIDEYGLDMVLKVVEILPKTNKRPRYEFPHISTPHQLKENWQKLSDGLVVKKTEGMAKKPKVIISTSK